MVHPSSHIPQKTCTVHYIHACTVLLGVLLEVTTESVIYSFGQLEMFCASFFCLAHDECISGALPADSP
jgi:hypothetical protein